MFVLLTTAAIAQVPERVYVPGDPKLPLSNAVIVDDTIYLAGHSWVDTMTRKPLKVEDEARAVLDAIKQTLAKSDATMEDLVSVTVYCSDLTTYDAFNAVYRTYFKNARFPARTFIGSILLFDARFEVQGIAIKRHR